jgi:addiction module RelE/StbE family toxin
MAKLVWLPQAKQDIERLHSFLKNKNPRAAKNAIRALRTGAKQLRDYPEAGRRMEDRTGRRELFVAFGAGGYVLRYMLDGQTVVVIRVWHFRERR